MADEAAKNLGVFAVAKAGWRSKYLWPIDTQVNVLLLENPVVPWSTLIMAIATS